MNEITIRIAEPNDAQALADLHAATILNRYSQDYDQDALHGWVGGHTIETWKQRIDNADFIFIVALIDGRIAGCCGLDKVKKRLGIHTHPDFHRKGVGTKLGLFQLDQAKRLGIDALDLSAPEKAVPFYKSLGFNVLQKNEHHALQSGSIIPVFDMKLEM